MTPPAPQPQRRPRGPQCPRGPRRQRWQGLFDEHLLVEPPLEEEQLGKIPAKRGVMALLGERDEVILLTTAADIRARLRNRLKERDEDERKKTADLRAVTRQILWKRATSHFEMDWRFLQCARAMYPKRLADQLAWRKPWFVHVDPAEEHPHFRREAGCDAAPGVHLGPFPSGKSADAFIETIEDAFHLCRHVRCLRQAPHGQRCTYAEMDRCLRVCDGTISLAEYRRHVGRAAAFAAGQRTAVREELTARMQTAAKELAFEAAAATKKLLARLADLDSPTYEHVAPLAEFRFLLIQRGPGRRSAKVFLVDRGHLAEDKPLAYPLKPRQLQAAVRHMHKHVEASAGDDPGDPWTLALVAHYLLAGEDRRGLILRWHAGLTDTDLADAIEDATQALHLHAPRPRGKKAKEAEEQPSEPSDPPDTPEAPPTDSPPDTTSR